MADLIELDLVVRDKGLKASVSTVERLERQIIKAQKAVDKNTISQARYNKILLAAKRDYQALGMSSQKATAQVRAFAAANKQAQAATVAQTGALNKQNAALNQTKNKMNGSNVAIQQLGYQFGDFAVQVQGGTSAFVAFSQQATQLVGILPLVAGPLGLTVGAAVGLSAALGLIIPIGSAVLRFFFDMGQSAKTTTKNLEGLSTAFSELETLSKDTAEAISMSFKGSFETARSELQGLLEDYRKVSAEVARDALSKAALPLIEGLSGQIDALQNSKTEEVRTGNRRGQTRSKTEEELAAIQSLIQENLDLMVMFKSAMDGPADKLAENMVKVGVALNKSSTATDEMKASFQAILKESGLLSAYQAQMAKASEEAAKADEKRADFLAQVAAENARLLAEDAKARQAAEDKLTRIRGLMGEISAETTKVTQSTIDLTNELGGSADEAIALQKALDSGKISASQLSGVDIRAAIGPAAVAAMELAKQLGISLRTAMAMSGMIKRSGPTLDPREPSYDADAAQAQRFKDMMESGELYKSTLEKITKTTKKAGATAKKAMTDSEKAAKAYADALDGTVVSAIGSVADAWGDFVVRGFKDFKGFASAVLNSFKSMIANMIAIAAKNRIMLSMGMGGVSPTAALGATQGGGMMTSMLGTMGTGKGLAGLAGGTGFMGGVGGGLAAFSGGVGAGFGASFGAAGSLLSGGATVAAGGMGVMATIGAAIPALAAVAVVIGLLRKKTKLLDSGLRTTVEGFDVAIETFKKTQSSRLFGLMKGSKRTGYEDASAEVADPLIEAIGDMQQSIIDAAGTLGVGADAFDDFSYQFKLSLKGLTEEEQMQKINEEITKMGDSFASLSGHFETMNELLAASQQRYDLTTRLLQLQGNEEELLRRSREREMEATHELNRELLQTIYSIEDLQAASARANQAVVIANQGVADANQAVADATASLRQAIDAEKGRIQASFASLISGLTERLDVANEAMDKSRSIYEMLSGALSSRQVGGDSAFAGRRSSSLAFLRGGDFKDEQKLENALNVVAEPSEQLFGSFVDYARDFGRTSAIIDDAKSIARVQLDADEKQVLLLQKRIDNAKASEEAQLAALDRQFDALTNVNSSVLSVKDAIGALGAAMRAQAAAVQAQARAAAVAAAAGAAAAARATAAATAAATAGNSGTDTSTTSRTDTSTTSRTDTVVNTTPTLPKLGSSDITTGSTGEASFYSVGGRNFGTSSQARNFIAAQNDIRGYAQGGYHTGGMRMVGERGPELEATGPARIFSHNQTSSMFKDPELVQEIRGLRSEVSGLRSEQRQMQASSSKYVKRNYEINRKWDVDGLPATRT